MGDVAKLVHLKPEKTRSKTVEDAGFGILRRNPRWPKLLRAGVIPAIPHQTKGDMELIKFVGGWAISIIICGFILLISGLADELKEENLWPWLYIFFTGTIAYFAMVFTKPN